MESRSMRHQRQARQKNKSTPSGFLATVNFLLFAIALGVTLLIAYNMIKYKIGQFRYINVIVLATLAVISILLLFLVLTRKAQKTTLLFLILYALAIGFGMWKMQEIIDVFSKFEQTQSYDEYKMSVAVLKDSSVTSIDQLFGTPLVAPTNLDGENITKLLDDIKNQKNQTFSTTTVVSYYEAYSQLLNGSAKAIVLNNAYEGLLEASDPDYASKIKKVYEFTVRVERQAQETDTETINSGVFTIYVSGIDTYGAISSVSRSDVNILMTVNMNTNKVLLTTTPRDSYVPIADGGMNQYDKLTHAGIYGVNASIHTLENLYGIPIDYYMRLNFTSFINLVDTVGGVDIYNEYAFPSHIIPGYTFPAGNLHLDSQYALAYVRERYNLVDGDNGRAANQQKVITALLNKLTSRDVLQNAPALVQQVSGAMVETNMSLETIMSIVNRQLNSGNSLNIERQALEVTGTMGLPSYAMPGYNLYMGVVNESSLETVKAKMQSVISGN